MWITINKATNEQVIWYSEAEYKNLERKYLGVVAENEKLIRENFELKMKEKNNDN